MQSYSVLIKVPVIVEADDEGEAIDKAIARLEDVADGEIFSEDSEVEAI